MRAIKLSEVYPVLTFCLGLTLHAADTNPPVMLSAASFDGQTIGVCFSEALDPTSATNLANYRIADGDLPPIHLPFRVSDASYAVVEAVLRPDQRSVIVKLSNPFPGDSFDLYAKNVKDPAGNSSPTGATTAAKSMGGGDIGQPGFDPLETGTFFNCEFGGYEVVAGGSGLEGTNDSFHFIYETPRSAALLFLAHVTSLEAANRFSSAGLMVRDDLSPGSRFFSLTVTPPDVPARDGSGNGANTIEVRYRPVAGGPAAELAVTNLVAGLPYADMWLELSLGGRRCSASFIPGQQDRVQLGEFIFQDPFSNQVLAGLATFSHNNSPGFTTKATYSNAGLLRGDVFQGPRLFAEPSITNLVFTWTEPFEFPYFLLSAPEPRRDIFWEPVTNQVSYQFTSSNVQASVTVPIASSTRFFGLRFARR